MSLDEKVGQLFMVAAYVDPEYARCEIGNSQIIQEIDSYITQYHVGALAYVGPSECIKQVLLTNHYQEISKYPLLIAQDLEWGLSMRIKDALRFPKNNTLSAIADPHLIYEMGREIGSAAKLIGVHMNLSPVLDVNIDPENIAINVRSFGSSPQEVAQKGIAMIHGLQDAGIIASAKHFPGLGDISIDPHLGLPSNYQNRQRLQNVELYPFIEAIKAGVLSIQTEHLIVPALEPDVNIPSSLSRRVVRDLLKEELGFTGLVLSGALRMRALTEHFSDKEIVLNAFLSGNDMLLMPQDFPQAYHLIKEAIEEGVIAEKDVDERVLKILQLKERLRLDSRSVIEVPPLEQFHSPSAQELKRVLFQTAVTLLRNEQNLIPLFLFEKGSVAYVQLGESSSSHYLDLLSKKMRVDPFILPLECDDPTQIQAIVKQLEGYSLIILAVYPADPRRIEQIRLQSSQKQKEELKQFRVHGLSASLVQFVNALQTYDKKTVVTFFGNSFGLPFFTAYSTVLMAYEADPDAEEAIVKKMLAVKNLQSLD